MRRPCKGVGFPKTIDHGTGNEFHRRPSNYQTNGFVGACPRPAVRPPGEEAHRRAAAGPAGHHHRDPVVRHTMESPATRRRTNEQRLRQTSLTPVGCNGSATRTGRDTGDVFPTVSCSPQAGDLREATDGGAPVGQGRTSTMKYRTPESQRPDRTVAGGTKRLPSKFYQVMTGYHVTRQYLHWTKNRPTP